MPDCATQTDVEHRCSNADNNVANQVSNSQHEDLEERTSPDRPSVQGAISCPPAANKDLVLRLKKVDSIWTLTNRSASCETRNPKPEDIYVDRDREINVDNEDSPPTVEDLRVGESNEHISKTSAASSWIIDKGYSTSRRESVYWKSTLVIDIKKEIGIDPGTKNVTLSKVLERLYEKYLKLKQLVKELSQ